MAQPIRRGSPSLRSEAAGERTSRPQRGGEPALPSPLDTPRAAAAADDGRRGRRAPPSASGWTVVPKAASFDDPLLSSLVALSQLLERPISPEALKAGLPLDGGRLTPELAVRAAQRAGLSARLVQRELARISDLTLPCILLLEGRGACVLVERLAGERASVVLPETGRGAREVPLAELALRYTGYALFARPEVRFDRRAEQVETAARPELVLGHARPELVDLRRGRDGRGADQRVRAREPAVHHERLRPRGAEQRASRRCGCWRPAC